LPVLSGTPCTLSTYRQFVTPVHAVFGWNDWDLPTPGDDIESITIIALSQNGTDQSYLRD
jgi:hypothetical protein